MNKLISIAAIVACVSTAGCGDNYAFRHATYVGLPYQYDDAGLPILQARNTDPGRYFTSPYRGRNWR